MPFCRPPRTQPVAWFWACICMHTHTTWSAAEVIHRTISLQLWKECRVACRWWKLSQITYIDHGMCEHPIGFLQGLKVMYNDTVIRQSTAWWRLLLKIASLFTATYMFWGCQIALGWTAFTFWGTAPLLLIALKKCSTIFNSNFLKHDTYAFVCTWWLFSCTC